MSSHEEVITVFVLKANLDAREEIISTRRAVTAWVWLWLGVGWCWVGCSGSTEATSQDGSVVPDMLQADTDTTSSDATVAGDSGPSGLCGTGEDGWQSKINIIVNVHHDPVGMFGIESQRVTQYESHREAFLWLQSLAEIEGFAISSMLTGIYAEFVVRQNHFDDFIDFMPGRRHLLGSHLHAHYKGPFDTGVYSWSESYDPQFGQQVWDDQIPYVNQIYEGLGVGAANNHVHHGAHNYGEDPVAILGVQPNDNAYPNFFDVVEGQRGLYHPYRPSMTEGLEDPTSPFIAIPLASGVFGGDQPHGPEGMVYGTLPFVQRDFLLEYLERWYHQRHQLPPRLWVFGWGIHPYQMVDRFVGTDGRSTREALSDYFSWINANFGEDTITYAQYEDVRQQFLEWESCNSDTTVYPSVSASPSEPLVSHHAQNIYDILLDRVDGLDGDDTNDHPFALVRLDIPEEELAAELANDLGERALLYIPGATPQVDVEAYFPERDIVQVTGIGDLPVDTPVGEIAVTPHTPILILTPNFERNQ